MSETTSPRRGLTRRSFLKTTGAVAGLTATASMFAPAMNSLANESKNSDKTKESKHTFSCAGNCGGYCFLQAVVRDGKVVNIENLRMPDPAFNQQCQKGMNHLQRIYDPLRIKYPMKRVGARGSGEWERISWEDAIQMICEKWKSYQTDFGNTSIVFFPGTGNYRPDSNLYPDRLINYMGASKLFHGYDFNGLYSMGATTGMGLCIYGNDWRDLKNAKTVFIWGTNVTEAMPVRWHYVKEAQEGGTRLITIDPNFTITASKSDEYVTIRPGTDGLLILFMLKTILDEGRQDEETLKRFTVAPFLVRDKDGSYVRLSDGGACEKGSSDDSIMVLNSEGRAVASRDCSDPLLSGAIEIDGELARTAYDLIVERVEEQSRMYDTDKIVELTGISQEALLDLTHQYIDGPTTILTGYGPDHYANGAQFYIGIATLAMLSGNMLKPGTGITGSNMSTTKATGLDVASITSPKDAPGCKNLYANYVPELVNTKKSGQETIDPKSLFIWKHNPLGNLPDHELWVDTFSKIDFIVMADVYMNESTKYVDMLLPVPHYCELEAYRESNIYWVLNEAAIDPPFECKGDFEIINLLGKGMGFDKEFSLTREEFNKLSFDNEVARSFNLSWDRLKKDKIVEAYPKLDTYYVHGSRGFATPTKRAQFYFEDIRPLPDIGQVWDRELESLFYWEPPHEAWFENELAKKYPLVFTTERSKHRVHTQWSYASNFLEIDPEPIVKINPADAQKRGIEDGDMVKIFNDRGFVVCRAWFNAGTRPGLVVMDHGWQEDQFVEGHYNSLTSIYTHPHFPSGCWFDALVEIVKQG